MAAKLRRDDELEETHEINVTPFIDVMLVLLIIFMVAAPLATVDINVNLPASTAKPTPVPDKPVYLTIKKDHSLAVNNDIVTADQLGPMLNKLTKGNHETRIYLRADKEVSYEELIQVMDQLRESGYLKVALVGLEAGG